MQREFDLTYLFIAHDLSVVEHISDRVAALEHCAREEPECKEVSPGHAAACWLLE